MRHITNKITLLSILLFTVTAAFGQGIKDMRINEVLVKNTASFENDYGERTGWIELHNTGYSNVNIAGNYLSVRRGDKTKTYKIPKNDPRTIIPPQGYVVFFADGVGSKGTFYTNFTLDDTGVILLLDASGKGTPIDSVSYDLPSIKENISIGYEVKEQGADPVWSELSSTTPAATNNTIEFESRDEVFRKLDPSGIVMSITAMSVVFMALIALYLIFKKVGQSHVKHAMKKEKTAKENAGFKISAVSSDDDINGEVIAAITMAVKKYEEDLHDIEATVLTINRVAKVYSPWSSKIYSMVPPPNKR